MRLNREELQHITGHVRPTAQVRWFKAKLGAEIPSDQFGPIITEAAYQELVRRSCGLSSAAPAYAQVRMRK
jgi:hypothetical protein